MKLLVDMNLSPGWVEVLMRLGWEAAHWSGVGEPGAHDKVVMDWARTNGYVLLTHDLDFTTILALTRASGPSVVQLRSQDLLSSELQSALITALHTYEAELNTGAIVSVDERASRIRILPIVP